MKPLESRDRLEFHISNFICSYLFSWILLVNVSKITKRDHIARHQTNISFKKWCHPRHSYPFLRFLLIKMQNVLSYTANLTIWYKDISAVFQILSNKAFLLNTRIPKRFEQSRRRSVQSRLQHKLSESSSWAVLKESKLFAYSHWDDR